MPTAQQPRLIWRLVEESFSEAAFLWGRFDRALDADDHTFGDVERWVHERLSGALEGVQLAGAAALPLLMEALGDSDPGYVGAAAYLLASIAEPSAQRLLEQSLTEPTAERISAVSRGLGRSGNTAALRTLWSRARDASASGRATILEALTFCGEAPEADWKTLLAADDASLRRAAASALTLLAPETRSDVMWLALRSPDSEVRNRAVLAGLTAGDSGGWRRCLEALQAPQQSCAPLMPAVAMLGSRTEQALVIEALKVPTLARAALWALGFAGTTAAVEACLAQLKAAEHTTEALEAISAITGCDRAQLLPTSPNDTPTPDCAAVERWWHAERKRYDRAARYQRGQLATWATLRQVFERSPTRRRHGFALELAVRSRGKHRLQTFHFCPNQRAQLAQLDALNASELREAVTAVGVAPLEEA